MMPQPRFTGDLSSLETHGFGHRSVTWWGVVAFFLIEGTAFAMGAAAYLYVMNLDQLWPPPDVRLPGLLAGTLFTVLILASEIPNTMLKHASEKGELRRVRALILAMSAVGTLLLAIRAFEFASLNVWWSDNAYGSVQWMLLGLHTLHIATDWVDTIVLAGLMHTRHAQEGRRFVDVSENAMYWRFVWLCWIPFYLMIYWLPRWVP